MEMENAAGPTIIEENKRLKEEREILLEAYAEIFRQRNQEQEKRYFDTLTGLMTRGAFVKEVEHYLDLANRGEEVVMEGKEGSFKLETISIIFFDIDNFKEVNDVYGHEAGDKVLKKVAATVRQYTRGYDPAGRWGGEEMLLAMIGADEEQAENKANFIREKIEQLDFSDINPNLKITISAGVATSRRWPEFDPLIKAADEALYHSKQSGRNQVTAFSDLPSYAEA